MKAKKPYFWIILIWVIFLIALFVFYSQAKAT